MTRLLVPSLAAACILSLTSEVSAQPKAYPLESAQGLRLVNVTAQPATLQGKKGLRVTATQVQGGPAAVEQLARVEGLTFANGVIEAEIAGVPAPGAPTGARGF